MKLSKSEIKALRNVIDYMYFIEEKHYMENPVDCHIFKDYQKLAKALSKHES